MSIKLSDRIAGRDNNLNLIRMISAMAVVISHSYPLTLGQGAAEPFEAATGYSLGGFSVAIFFCISGLLISRSFERNDRLKFIEARILRLWPGLLTVILLAVFVVGPIFTTLSVGQYFSKYETWRYIPANAFLYKMQYELPGVFDTNPYSSVVNGSLWTLFYEVFCYAMVFALGVIGLIRRGKLFAIFAVAFIAAHYAFDVLSYQKLAFMQQGKIERLTVLLQLGYPFVIGMAAYIYREKLPLSIWLALVAIVVPVTVSGNEKILHEVTIISISYLTIFLSYVPKGIILKFNGLGDYSYGMYIYAFPIQQIIAHFLHNHVPWENASLGVLFTLPISIISWHFLEKKALSLSRKSPERGNSLRQEADGEVRILTAD